MGICVHLITPYSFLSLLSTEGFSQSHGGRPEAARLLVVVTDGESHDGEELPTALKACEAGRVTRYGIAVRLYFGSGRVEGGGDGDIEDWGLEGNRQEPLPRPQPHFLSFDELAVFCTSSNISLRTAHRPHLDLLTPGPRSLPPETARSQLFPAGNQSNRQ